MTRPISIGLAPNLEVDDAVLAFKNILKGKLNYSGPEIKKAEDFFNKTYNFKRTFLLNAGRSALYLALKAIGIKNNDEVIVQAFTCVAVPNCVIWTGAIPKFVDIDKRNLGIDIKDLAIKINQKTKVIILQYNFGIPGNIEEIITLCRKKNIVIIEDCAHCIKIEYKNRYLGNIGDLTIFSFGRDKAISTVSGGALSVNNEKYLSKVEKLYDELKYPGNSWILKQHFHLLVMLLILPTYNFLGIGKILLEIVKKLNLITLPVDKDEKNGLKPEEYPKKMPSSLVVLLNNQINKIDKFNNCRKHNVEIYLLKFQRSSIRFSKTPLLRFPLLVEDREEVLAKAKNKNIILGTWYSNIIDPKGTNLDAVGYTLCPNAEYVAQHIINLPTYPAITKIEAEKVVFLLQKSTIL